VAVVGGGVAGLATAYRLTVDEPDVDVTLLEASDRVGGKLRSIEVGDLVLEAGADSFVARRPWAVELCKELGLGADLITPASSSAYVWTDAGLERYVKGSAFGIPGDVGDVLRWPGLSRAGRMRAARDLVKKTRKSDEDESLGALLRRRLGDEATDLSVGPLLAGLFAGDVDRLSVRATFPELADWERTQGSLIRGSQAATRNAASARGGSIPPMFVKLQGGVSRLTDELARQLGDRVRTAAPVTAISASGSGFEVGLGDASTLSADDVILASPAWVAADLVGGLAPEAADELTAIPYASTGVVLLVYGDGTKSRLPEGSGFVVPRGKAPMTACTWVSNKWPEEAFRSRAVLRCYVGGVGDEDVLDASDDDIVQACLRHVAAVVDLPDGPEHSAVHRWMNAMPQYEVGHLDRVRRIRAALPPGIVVTGSAYGGVGIPDCIRQANETAAAIHETAGTDKETV
jgi:oxygen-dependent protoporphyrinogen oxidase